MITEAGNARIYLWIFVARCAAQQPDQPGQHNNDDNDDDADDDHNVIDDAVDGDCQP